MQAKSQFKSRSSANGVEIRIPVPPDVDSPSFKVGLLDRIHEFRCIFDSFVDLGCTRYRVNIVGTLHHNIFPWSSCWVLSLRTGWYWNGYLHARWRLHHVVNQTGLHAAQFKYAHRNTHKYNKSAYCGRFTNFAKNKNVSTCARKHISPCKTQYLSLCRLEAFALYEPARVWCPVATFIIFIYFSSSVRRSISCARTSGCRRSLTVATPTRGRSVCRPNQPQCAPPWVYVKLRSHRSTGPHHGQIRDPILHRVRHSGAYLQMNSNAGSCLDYITSKHANWTPNVCIYCSHRPRATIKGKHKVSL